MCNCEDRPCCGHDQETRMTDYYRDDVVFLDDDDEDVLDD